MRKEVQTPLDLIQQVFLAKSPALITNELQVVQQLPSLAIQFDLFLKESYNEPQALQVQMAFEGHRLLHHLKALLKAQHLILQLDKSQINFCDPEREQRLLHFFGVRPNLCSQSYCLSRTHQLNASKYIRNGS